MHINNKAYAISVHEYTKMKFPCKQTFNFSSPLSPLTASFPHCDPFSKVSFLNKNKSIVKNFIRASQKRVCRQREEI